MIGFLAKDRMWCANTRRRTDRRETAVRPHRRPHISSLPRMAATMLLPVLVCTLGGCHSSGLPRPATAGYLDEVTAFYVGLAALQVGDDVRADRTLERATQLAEGEPASWANWGVLALRQGNFDAAAQRLNRAQKLLPQNDQIHYLLGVLESKRGNPSQAIVELRKAVDLDSRNLRAMYLLAQEVERQGDVNGEVEFQQLLQKILAQQPGNPAVLLDLGRVAAKRGDSQTLHSVVNQISTNAATWPPEVQQQWTALQAVVAGPDPRAAAVRIAFLRNSLMRVPEFRQSLGVIQPTAGNEALPFSHFLLLLSPSFAPPPADTAIRFPTTAITNPGQPAEAGPYSWIGAIPLTGAGAPVIAVANSHNVKLATGAAFPFPGVSAPLLPESVLPVDFNYDFKTDLVLAGESGVRFMRQESATSFTDVTAQTKLPPALLHAPYTGAWAIDVEADGDMDILLGSPQGPPVVLRNNGDGTFAATQPFPGISGLRGFAWADLDGDGNPDAAIIDGSSVLHFFHNQRSAVFREVKPPDNLPHIRAVTVADVGGAGTLSLVAVEDTGALVAISHASGAAGWTIAQLGNATRLAPEVRLRAADLDNNGAMDLLLLPITPPAGAPAGAPVGAADGLLVWLGNGAQKFTPLPQPVGPPRVFDVADVNNDGRLDLLGLSSAGQAQQALNAGEKKYHWQILRPRARQATGDQRINSFGIGGEMELRSGLLVQKQPINTPQLHFGLGNQASTDVVRILWPNGAVSAEFALQVDQEVLTEQRLKGSCPFLFAWNGKEIDFVKDAVPWGSAIGLQIDSVGSPGIAATEEWYKIGADQLAPHDGYYDLRLTGELWETYYYDYLKLMVVDHPADTEIFTDERFVVPPVKLAITAVAHPRPVAKAIDDQGNDVTQIVSKLDGNYLDTFGRGQYQGLTRDHYVEIDLGGDVPASGPVWLIARGWLHPTDSTVNVAIGQGNHQKAHALSLEVPDGHGGWRTARANLGFPAGRKKTCLFNLENIFLPGAPRKLRLRTNLEIYWDSIEWAQGRPDARLNVTQLSPSLADLHYRGYSQVSQANASSPELPDYKRIAATTQIWRDLEGYYTRYGDVRELLGGIDDRYVIMNAGDEITLHFAQQGPPPAGWVRDYVIAGDGWIKDGDYNSTYSRTVQPLPYHAKSQYNDPPGRLEDEYVYRHHPQDWQKYHTRYVTPEPLDQALRSGAAQ
jgi:Flp pilus assembly protein TadD